MKNPFAAHLGIKIVAAVWLSIFICFALFALSVGKPATPVNCPPELFTLSPCSSTFHSSRVSQRCLLAYQPTPVSLDFSFEDQIEAVEGYWYGENASVSINGGARKLQGTPDHTKRNWPDTITVTERRIGERDPKPSFEIRLPQDAKDIHQTLQISAAMDVDYPQLEDTGFTNADRQLTKDYTVFVVSPEEMAFRRTYDLWKNKAGATAGLVLIGVFGGFIILFVGFVMTRPRSAVRRRSSSAHPRSDLRSAAQSQRFRR